MDGKPLRVGLIGANWGLTHIMGWRAVPGVEIAAICTSRRETAEAAAQAHGIAGARWDASAMIADPDIDIVDITVRPSIRAPLALETLRAGKSLLQTIPFALDLKQALTLRDLARENRGVAMLESLHRHAPAFRQAKAMIDAGAIGEVQSIRGHVRTGILLNRANDWPYRWIVDANGGASALRNFGAHLIHTLVWFFGPVERVTAQISSKLPHIAFTDGGQLANGVADTASVLMRLESGADANIEATWCTPGSDGFMLDAVGNKGRLRVSADFLGPQNPRIEFAATAGLTEQVPLDPGFAVIDGAPDVRDNPANGHFLPVAAMCARLAAAIRGDDVSASTPDFEEAWHVMQVVEAAYRSQAAGRWTTVADIAP